MDLIEKVEQGITYAQYIKHLQNQLAEKKEDEKMLNYIFLNVKRMQRIEKQYEPAPYLLKLIQRMNAPVTWLTITEGWCGDAAHVLPVLEKLSTYSFKPRLKIISRDEHPELINQFLTDGARSIPKVIAIDHSGKVINVWGPRPKKAQKIVVDYKQGNSDFTSYEELTTALQKWYHYDRYTSFESEIIEFIEAQIKAKVQPLY
jgi:hypothetical protein